MVRCCVQGFQWQSRAPPLASRAAPRCSLVGSAYNYFCRIVVVRAVVLSTSIRRPQYLCLAWRSLPPASPAVMCAAYCLLQSVKRGVNTSYSRLLTVSRSRVRCLVRWRVGRKTVSFSECCHVLLEANYCVPFPITFPCQMAGWRGKLVFSVL